MLIPTLKLDNEKAIKFNNSDLSLKKKKKKKFFF